MSKKQLCKEDFNELVIELLDYAWKLIKKLWYVTKQLNKDENRKE